MAFKDLREFIEELERRRLLKRIKVPVSAELEITDRAMAGMLRCFSTCWN